MQFIQIRKALLVTALLGGTTFLLLLTAVRADAQDGPPAPALPAVCGNIRVEEGNQVAFQAYAIGVQIWRWTGSAWAFVAPEANLYANAGYRGQTATHYAGPTWESISGSKVIAARVDGCTPDADSIPWLILRKVSTEGSGQFADITFIQRVNTNGGNAPSAAGSYPGEERRVPYTAEYYFYRASN